MCPSRRASRHAQRGEKLTAKNRIIQRRRKSFEPSLFVRKRAIALYRVFHTLQATPWLLHPRTAALIFHYLEVQENRDDLRRVLHIIHAVFICGIQKESHSERLATLHFQKEIVQKTLSLFKGE